MKRISQLKDEAIVTLHGNWGKAALASLGLIVVSIAFNMFFTLLSGTNILDYYEALFSYDFSSLKEAMGGNIYVSILQGLGGILFTTPLGIGVYNSFRVLFESKGADNAIFNNFFKLVFNKDYLHIVLVSFCSGFLIGLMMIPAIIVLVLIGIVLESVVATVFLVIAGIVYIVWIAIIYSQISFIMVNNPELDIIDTMRRSRTLMYGNKWRYLGLGLSFLGWLILGIFTLGIGYLWLLPYIYTTESAFYCDIRDAANAAE